MEEDLKKIYDSFKRNLLGAVIISEIDVGNYPKDSFADIEKEINSLDSEIGLGRLSRNQSVVLIVSAFECFFREFFEIIIEKDIPTRNRITKLLKNKDFELDLEKIRNICEKKFTLGKVICEKCSFTSMNELEKLCDSLGIDLDDLFIIPPVESEGIIKNIIEKKLVNKGVLEKIIFIRNKFIHEGELSQITNLELNSLAISLQFMAINLISTFSKKNISFTYFFK
jgi:hypothetical protein